MEFLGHVTPPGDLLNKYDKSKSYKDQTMSQNPSDQIPQAFLDAMSVRETVFCGEQNCPLEGECDVNDPRCWHWVCYASVSTPGSSGPAVQHGFGAASDDRRKSSATASKLPVGTIRLVPPPHEALPQPGSRWKVDKLGNMYLQQEGPSTERVPTVSEVPGVGTVDYNESYIMLGRIAVLSAYRKLGLAKLLVDAACDWASKNASEIVPKVEASARERAHVRQQSEGLLDRHLADPAAEPEERRRSVVDEYLPPWNGLVLLHAQAHLEKLYNRYGFVRDESLGIWYEEEIPHIGMVRRLHIQDKR